MEHSAAAAGDPKTAVDPQPLELSEALTQAMAAAGLRDEQVAVNACISAYTVQSIRLRRVKNPRPIVIAALRREVPGLADLLDGKTKAVA